MEKCLQKYHWIKLYRNKLPQGKGIMGYWAKLASRAAFRTGTATYCGYKNDVEAGMWSGGIVGLKSILGIKNKSRALEIMDILAQFGYINYFLDSKTKKLTYQINDWINLTSNQEYSSGNIYATTGYGFICIPRDLTQRLVEQQYKFSEADAWIDLWCHSVSNEPGNIFSFLATAIQLKWQSVLTLEELGRRWRWEKTKVWRFFKKYKDVFPLYRLPGSYGCLIFNISYFPGTNIDKPSHDVIMRIVDKIRILAKNTHCTGKNHNRINKLVSWFSQKISIDDCIQNSDEQKPKGRVALLDYIIRAYISLEEFKNNKSYIYDCVVGYILYLISFINIRGPCKNKNLEQ